MAEEVAAAADVAVVAEVAVVAVVTFKGRKKSLVMNRTNYDAVADLHGEETNDWPGKTIELYPTRTSMGGKTMDCIRVRGTSKQTFSDEVPF